MNMNFSSPTERILSFSEQQVVQLFSQGYSIDEISIVLLLPTDTIEILKQNISKKLDVRIVAEAVYKARLMHLI